MVCLAHLSSKSSHRASQLVPLPVSKAEHLPSILAGQRPKPIREGDRLKAYALCVSSFSHTMLLHIPHFRNFQVSAKQGQIFLEQMVHPSHPCISYHGSRFTIPSLYEFSYIQPHLGASLSLFLHILCSHTEPPNIVNLLQVPSQHPVHPYNLLTSYIPD